MIDPGVHLPRAVDELLLWEEVDDQLAVMRHVGAGREPRGHVVPLGRREGDQQDELFLRRLLGVTALGQLHDRVVRLHVLVLLLRNAPEVFLVVEDLRVLHVVRGVDVGLDREQILRVAQVRPEVSWHLLKRLQ